MQGTRPLACWRMAARAFFGFSPREHCTKQRDAPGTCREDTCCCRYFLISCSWQMSFVEVAQKFFALVGRKEEVE